METIDITYIIDKSEFYQWLDEEQICYQILDDNLLKVKQIDKIIIQEFWGI